MPCGANAVLTVRTPWGASGQLETHTHNVDASANATQATVVVCAFSSARLEQTVAGVGSVLHQEPPPAQIVVVVDHNDALETDLRDRLPQEVEVGSNPDGRGLSSARNAAIARSRGDYIVFIDDDAVAHDQWLVRLLSAFDDPAVIGAGGHARPLWAEPPPDWFPPEFLWVVGCSYAGLPDAGSVRNPLGCNMAFRAEVFRNVGMFNPAIGRLGSLPLGCEETEFCLRASRAVPDARIALVSGAEIDHHVPAARATVRYLPRRCYFEGISKALVRRLGDRRSLDTERTYLRNALPARVKASIRRALGGHVAEGLGLVGALVGSVGAAAAGYLVGVVVFRVRPPAVVAPPPDRRPADVTPA
jgi:glycosyltransferase involved in cell wall biosynthesis